MNIDNDMITIEPISFKDIQRLFIEQKQEEKKKNKKKRKKKKDNDIDFVSHKK